MKTIFKTVALAAIAVAATTSCEPEKNEPATKVLTFEGSEWTDLIDNPQYGGKLLYGDKIDEYTYSGTDYSWHDKGNTELASELCESYGSKVYWNGGEAISNYTGKNNTMSYEEQLAIPLESGHNGSKNFCVHNGYKNEFNNNTSGYIYFADGVERVIESMYVTNTCLYLGTTNLMLKEDSWTKIVATGYNAEGETVGTSEFFLTKDGQSIKEWTKWDMSGLGEVAKVDFDIQSSLQNEYGMAAPAYFAYDDVAVRM